MVNLFIFQLPKYNCKIGKNKEFLFDHRIKICSKKSTRVRLIARENCGNSCLTFKLLWWSLSLLPNLQSSLSQQRDQYWILFISFRELIFLIINVIIHFNEILDHIEGILIYPCDMAEVVWLTWHVSLESFIYFVSFGS